MSGVPEVVKGCFEFSIAGAVLTVAAKGVTKVRFPKAASPGLFVTLDLTGKSYSFDTDSYPANAGCGITTTVDWANAMPWFVYLGNEDDTAANVFAFNTRDPRMTVTPAAGLINDTDAIGATAQSQNHINSWKADDAGIAAKPCICIGSHTMTWETDAAPVADVWELVALTTADGFGMFQEGVQFTMPNGQNGCAEAGNTYDGAGVATNLEFGANSTTYTLDRDGVMSFWSYHANAGTNGGDAANFYQYLPYVPETTSQFYIGTAYWLANTVKTFGLGFATASAAYIYFYNYASGALLEVNDFANAGDDIYITVRAKVF